MLAFEPLDSRNSGRGKDPDWHLAELCHGEKTHDTCIHDVVCVGF